MADMENTVEKVDGIEIAEEVVAVITGVSASETEGVAQVGSGSLASNWTELISGKKNNAKGIKILMGEGNVSIDIQIVVKYGARIPDVATLVQENVKNSVEEMTGINVTRVDVNVVGVKTASAKEKKESLKESVEVQDSIDN